MSNNNITISYKTTDLCTKLLASTLYTRKYRIKTLDKSRIHTHTERERAREIHMHIHTQIQSFCGTKSIFICFKQTTTKNKIKCKFVQLISLFHFYFVLLRFYDDYFIFLSLSDSHKQRTHSIFSFLLRSMLKPK